MKNGLIEPLRDDLESMTRLFEDGQVFHHQLFSEIFCKPDNHEEIETYLASYLKPKNFMRKRRCFAMCSFHEDQMQGYLLYQLHKSSNVFFGQDRWFGYVVDIAVDQRFRKMGVATNLLSFLDEQIQNLGGGLISGQVWNGNAASEKLFENNGFEWTAKQFYRVS